MWGIVFYVIVVTSISSTIYHLTGKKVDEGTPNTAWVGYGIAGKLQGSMVERV